MSNRIHIVRSGKQFYAVSVGANGEPLHNSELETTKENVWKNILADFQQTKVKIGKRWAQNGYMEKCVQDDTGKKSKAYSLMIDLKTRKATKEPLDDFFLSKPYVPKRKRKKNGRKD